MHSYLCQFLPYREETWQSSQRRTYLIRFSKVKDRLEYSTIGTDPTIPKEMKWHWGHNWDLTAHGPSGSSFICMRCGKR